VRSSRSAQIAYLIDASTLPRRIELLADQPIPHGVVGTPDLAKARSERQAALRAMMRSVTRAPDAFVLKAEAAFRETVAHMGKVLQGENLIEARELLRELLGTIRLQPDAGHLIAEFERPEIPLLAVGNGRWVGSGGVLPIHLPDVLVVRRRRL